MTQIKDIRTQAVYDIDAPRAGENNLACPKCSSERRKKRARSLQWNAAKGVGQCYHCSAAFVEHKPFTAGRREKEYAVPQWKNRTDLSDHALSFFTGRMISQDTLRRMRIYSDTEWMPQFGAQVPVICFPFMRSGELVNVKYRGPQKSFKMVSGAELVFFNLDCVPTARELVITEGEMDALSFIEAGIENVVSVPNGAAAGELPYLDSCIDDLAHIETFYIAVDFDEPGIKLQQELIRRLGAERCRVVTYEGCKDANELLCLPEGAVRLRSALANAIQTPITDVLDLPACYNDIVAVFENGLNKGQEIGLEAVDRRIQWKTGQLAIWTGIPSHGKSEMLNFFAARWNLELGWKCAFFSPENMPYQRYLYPKLASVIAGKEFRRGFMPQDEFDQTFDYITDNFKFIDAGDDFSVETVVATARSLVKRYGIKVLVIDPYNCFEHRQQKGENETQYIGRFLDTLSRFARKYDVLVNLVAHPRKMERMDPRSSCYQVPTLYDINGSANFYNKADIGITVYRHFGKTPDTPTGSDMVLNKIRFKEQGTAGEKVNLQYNFRNGRYEEPKGDIRLLDNSNWLRSRNPDDDRGDTACTGDTGRDRDDTGSTRSTGMLPRTCKTKGDDIH